HFAVTSTFDSNPLVSTVNPGNSWTVWTSPSAGLDLHRLSGNSDLTLSYLLAASLSNTNGVDRSIAQQLGLSQKLTWHRSVITLMDQFAQLPASGFGYGGFGTPIIATGGSLDLQNAFTPDQSILTSRGRRISNTSLVEVDTFLTRRTSITLVGSY